MRVSAASLLTAVALSSLIGGGSAAAPKPLMEVDNLVASPAQVEHVDSRHADVRDGIPRRVELRRRVFVSTLVVALSSLAVVYLVVQCTRFLSKLNSAPFGQQRLLADGGVDASCGAEATGGEEETRLPAELLPSALAGRVDLQRALLQVTEEDRSNLPQELLLNIIDAQKALREAEDRVAVARHRLVEVEKKITRYHQDVLHPGVTPTTSDLETLGKLEERKQALQKRFNQENTFLSSIAYQPSQARRAFLKYATSQASGTPLSERLAETLVAAELVLNPGKAFSDVPTSLETHALILLSDKLRKEVEDLADMVIGVRELPQGMDFPSVRSLAEARAVYMSMFVKKLTNVGMPETSAQVQSSLGILRNALVKTPVQPPPPPPLPPSTLSPPLPPSATPSSLPPSAHSPPLPSSSHFPPLPPSPPPPPVPPHSLPLPPSAHSRPLPPSPSSSSLPPSPTPPPLPPHSRPLPPSPSPSPLAASPSSPPLASSATPPPLSPSLEAGMAELSLEEEEKLKSEVSDLKHGENILLSTSKEASKAAAAPTPADDEGWMEIHKRLVDLATTYIMWSNRTVSPNVPEDVKNAYAVAVNMCQRAIERLVEKLTPFWMTKTQEMYSQLNESLTEVLDAEKNLVGVLPEGDDVQSPVMDIAERCRTRMIAASDWTNQLDLFEKAHPFVSQIIGQKLSHLKSTFASSDESVVRLLDRHAEKLAATITEALGRAQSFLPGQLSYADGLGMQDLLKAARQDVRGIHEIIGDPSKTLIFLEANLKALEKALETHLNPTQQRGGSLRRKRSFRLWRKGDSGGKK